MTDGDIKKSRALLYSQESDIHLMRAGWGKALDDIERLRGIILQQLTENDELGSEYTYVMCLKEENARLRAALEEIRDHENSRVNHEDDCALVKRRSRRKGFRMTNEQLEILEARAELAAEVTLPGEQHRELLAEIRRLRDALAWYSEFGRRAREALAGKDRDE